MSIKTTFASAVALIWISVSLAVIAGLYFTKNAYCLWAFAIPVFAMKYVVPEANDSKED